MGCHYGWHIAVTFYSELVVLGALPDVRRRKRLAAPAIVTYSYFGWDVLISGFLPGPTVSLTRHLLTDAKSGAEAERKNYKCYC